MIQKTFFFREIASFGPPSSFSKNFLYRSKLCQFLIFSLSITELCWFKQVCIFTRRRWCWFWRFRIDKEERNTESADTKSEIFRQKERKLFPKKRYIIQKFVPQAVQIPMTSLQKKKMIKMMTLLLQLLPQVNFSDQCSSKISYAKRT